MNPNSTNAAEGASHSNVGLGACKWTEDDAGIWNTECGDLFVVNEGSPEQNDMKFCCYCGKPINQIDYVFWADINVSP